MFYHNDGYFVVIFHSIEEKDEVLFYESYTMNSSPVIKKAWSTEFCFKEKVLRTIPLWVKLLDLPLNCWTSVAMSKIGSGVGKTVCADACTTNIERISYTRLLIEMDVMQALPHTVKACDSYGRVFDQLVVYEWRPQYCSKCCKLGHVCNQQRKKPHK